MRDLTIENKWQSRWDDAEISRPDESSGAPYYCLEMLPYPSGKLHMGHVRNYSIGDAMARFERMRGRRVLHVMGWDAFGMPAENAAIQHGENPAVWTRRNIASMRAQFKRLGFSYDWSREIASCDPEYYRWNQWFFLRMFEKDLAYRARRLLNWCATCETVLANEQVVGGRCWRCDNPVRRREFDQWFLRTTSYAEELLADLDGLTEWPERVRTMQRNWIGRSEGTHLTFNVDGSDERIEVFTTRPDTVFGATYVALAVEHPVLNSLVAERPEKTAVLEFADQQLAKNVEERFAEGAVKQGISTGRFAINPFSGERIPIWVANFVLMDVGTGAIMSVPAHDQRDFDFARAYGLPIRPVVHAAGEGVLTANSLEAAFGDRGVLNDSGRYSGLTSAEAGQRIAADAEAGAFGRQSTIFRIKDWGISRQRFWGTPIPVVHCTACGPVGIPDDQLPVVLPEDVDLTGEGGSPLAQMDSFVKTVCPKCGGAARRETDTMDTFVDSSWYYFRYLDPKNSEAPFDPAHAATWAPVDLYVGGIEHATMHLIYTRFWSKMMRDMGLVAFDEPIRRLFTQGMVVKDGAKMSKSKGNVVDPDLMIEQFGADTTRLFCLFAAPPDRDLEWSEAGVEGCARFLARIERAFENARDRLPDRGAAVPPGIEREAVLGLRRKTHKTIERVTYDLAERMRMNTAVSAIMELINATIPHLEDDSSDAAIWWAVREAFEVLARLLVPFAPHFAEELWESLGGNGFASCAAWPVAEPALLVEDQVTVSVQVSGKMRGLITLERGTNQEIALAAAKADPRVVSHLEGKTLRRVIWIPDRLLNLVVS